jgi:hypothetical protein
MDSSISIGSTFSCRTIHVDAPSSGVDLLYRGAKAAFRKYDHFAKGASWEGPSRTGATHL